VPIVEPAQTGIFLFKERISPSGLLRFGSFHPFLFTFCLRDAIPIPEFLVLLEWNNIYYESKSEVATTIKKIVRLGQIHRQMRFCNGFEDLMQQVEFLSTLLRVTVQILPYSLSFSMPR
jgi:hypothetical protein